MDKVLDIYKELYEGDLFYALAKYISNSRMGLVYDFKGDVIPIGSTFYRIRRYKENTDFSNSKEWGPPPLLKIEQGRCNNIGEKVLYLGSTELICLLETHIQPNEKYVLGKYTTVSDIKVGGYTSVKPNESEWKIAIAMAFNAFLIAPARGEKNTELFKIIDKHYGKGAMEDILLKDVCVSDNMKLPYKIGGYFEGDNYYKLTNSMCSVIKKRYPMGIRYSSCYIPMETVGIECSEYNIALYESALSKVKFQSFEIKTNTNKAMPEGIAEILLKSKKH